MGHRVFRAVEQALDSLWRRDDESGGATSYEPLEAEQNQDKACIEQLSSRSSCAGPRATRAARAIPRADGPDAHDIRAGGMASRLPACLASHRLTSRPVFGWNLLGNNRRSESCG